MTSIVAFLKDVTHTAFFSDTKIPAVEHELYGIPYEPNLDGENNTLLKGRGSVYPVSKKNRAELEIERQIFEHKYQ